MFVGDLVGLVTQGVKLKREELTVQVEAAKADAAVLRMIRNETQGWSTGDSDEKGATEFDRIESRRSVRELQYKSPLIKGSLRTVQKYVVGKGATIKSKSKREDIQDFVAQFVARELSRKRQKECVRRAFRDGELFTELFAGNELVTTRFQDPEIIGDPVGQSQGIVTDPNDVETVEEYLIAKQGRIVRRVPEFRMLHLKLDVDSNEKRGITPLKAGVKWALEYDELLRYRVSLNKARAALVMVKKVKGGTRGIQKAASRTPATQVTGNTGEHVRRSKMPAAGTMITIGMDEELKFENANIGAHDAEPDLRAVRLQFATALGWPEYLITSDASNANMASTMVAESPGVRDFEDLQGTFSSYITELIRRALILAEERNLVSQVDDYGVEIEWGELVHRDEEKSTKRRAILYVNKAISRRTWQMQEGLDPDFEAEQLRKEDAEDGIAPPESGDANPPGGDPPDGDSPTDDERDDAEDSQ